MGAFWTLWTPCIRSFRQTGYTISLLIAGNVVFLPGHGTPRSLGPWAVHLTTATRRSLGLTVKRTWDIILSSHKQLVVCGKEISAARLPTLTIHPITSHAVKKYSPKVMRSFRMRKYIRVSKNTAVLPQQYFYTLLPRRCAELCKNLRSMW